MLHETNQPSSKLSGKDVSTFTKTYKYLFTALCAFADKIVKSLQVAKDIVQNVFISLWENAVSFSRYEQIRSWLYTSTENASINYATRNRYTFCSSDEVNALRNEVDSEHEIDTDILMKQIAIAVGKMPKQRRRVFVMWQIHKKSNEVIAKRLGITPATVFTHRGLALDEIRLHLRKYLQTHA